MDLRMVKTRKQIKEAFLYLRAKLMPDKIKVKDICEVAMINKTTFYNHYADSAQLSDEIDDFAIDKVMSGFSEKEKVFDDPKVYIIGLLRSLEKESSYLKIVFRGKQDVLCSKLYERLHRYYDDRVSGEEDKIKLSFIIGGFVSVVRDHLMKDTACDVEGLARATSSMIEPFLKSKAASDNA